MGGKESASCDLGGDHVFHRQCCGRGFFFLHTETTSLGQVSTLHSHGRRMYFFGQKRSWRRALFLSSNEVVVQGHISMSKSYQRLTCLRHVLVPSASAPALVVAQRATRISKMRVPASHLLQAPRHLPHRVPELQRIDLVMSFRCLKKKKKSRPQQCL